MKTQSFLLGVLCMCLSACGGGAYEESTEGLKSMMTDLYEKANADDDAGAEAIAQQLVMEDDGADWFKAHYGDDTGESLAAEYAQRSSNAAAGLVKLMRSLKEKGRTEFLVEKFTDAKDENAVGYQQAALKAAKEPVTLYSFRAVEPGKKSGQHLYNFVYEDGWRFAGPMKALSADMANDQKMDAASSLRVKDRVKYFETGELPD